MYSGIPTYVRIITCQQQLMGRLDTQGANLALILKL